MKTPRYNDVPVFGQDINSVDRRYADYGGFLRCVGTLVLTIIFLLFSVSCMFAALYLLYPLDPPAATNILVLGVDTRATSGEETAIGRTDTIMIVSIDPQREQISMLSIPRDLILNAPNYGRLRANTIIRNAELDEQGTGLETMVGAVENTFDIDIDHTMRVDFQGFVDVIDALGGVDVNVPSRIVDSNYPLPDDSGTTTLIFEQGIQWMDGERALQYARTRQADTDYARAGRQQQLIIAMMDKLQSPRGIARMPAVLNALNRNTDSDMGWSDVLRYLPGVLHYADDGIQTQIITPEYIIIDGTVALPDVEKLRPWIDTHLRHDGLVIPTNNEEESP